MSELKLCPFCGFYAGFEKTELGFRIKCFGKYRHTFDSWFNTKKEAIAAWNKRQPEWINVKDRLPPQGVPILCYQEIWGISIGVMDELCQFRFDHPGDTLRSTHWQELPKPPKE